MSNLIDKGVDRIAREQQNPERIVPEAQFQAIGFYVGQVMDDKDDQQNGRVWVYIPEFSAQRNDPSGLPINRLSNTRKPGKNRNADVIDYSKRNGWVLCSPMFPFFGSDGYREETSMASTDDRSPRDGEANSYGMWYQPRNGDYVGVLFANGDPSRGYWIGMVPKPFSNFMVPGHPAAKLGKGPAKINDKPVDLQPLNVEGPGMETARASNTPRRPSKVFNNNLKYAGLGEDETRGAGRSSARRDAPSQVFGFKTPGDPETLMMGHQLVMDDHPKYQSVRMRTSKGAQVLLSDACDFIYINTAQGNVWMQFDDSGNLKVYAGDSISLHAMRDLNLTVDRNLNVDVRGDMNWVVKGASRIEYQGKTEITYGKNGGDLLMHVINDMSVLADKNLKFEATLNANVKSGQEIRYTSGTGMAITAGENLNVDGQFIFWGQAGSAADAATASVSTVIMSEASGPPAYPYSAPGQPGQYAAPIVPQHEPWNEIVTPCTAVAGYDGLVGEADDPPARNGASSETATKPDDLNTPSGIKRGNEYQTSSKAEAPTYTTEATTDDFQSVNDLSLDQAGLDAIKKEEGFRACSYNDVGRRAIGYGHNVRAGENIPECISKEQAEAILMRDTQEFERCVKSSVTQPVTQAQYNAMVSLAYNIGCGGFKNSTAVKELNAGNYEKVPEAWMRWTKAGGQSNNPVLVARRRRELAMFNTASPATS